MGYIIWDTLFQLQTNVAITLGEKVPQTVMEPKMIMKK